MILLDNKLITGIQVTHIVLVIDDKMITGIQVYTG